MQAGLNQRIYLQDVAVRDGFQIEPRFIPTAEKIGLINALGRTGLAKIEVTSFTSPKAIPALADAEEVMLGIERVPGVVYTVLVPNMRGAERAMGCRADEFNLVMSVSETHNLTNLRMTREQSFAQLAEVIEFSRSSGVSLNVSLSCSFGCPMEGDIPADEVFHWAGRFIEMGVRGITLCDTTGMAYPTQVSDICRSFKQRWENTELTLHFHNTRGMGLANALSAVGAGVDRFDASLGGLGGCPYAPGATGNICTEDLAHMLELMGYDTAVDTEALIACARQLPAMLGHEIPGQVAKAGKVSDLHARPDWFAEVAQRAHEKAEKDRQRIAANR
ncbi:MAG TPA: hydroxymethylglutaryl-CoA lyase [Burkholderiaceae bacterium]|nr:hydroxymethylglutaryl-CoA lyase [Burkholderiaceae bacterium]